MIVFSVLYGVLLFLCFFAAGMSPALAIHVLACYKDVKSAARYSILTVISLAVLWEYHFVVFTIAVGYAVIFAIFMAFIDGVSALEDARFRRDRRKNG